MVIPTSKSRNSENETPSACCYGGNGTSRALLRASLGQGSIWPQCPSLRLQNGSPQKENPREKTHPKAFLGRFARHLLGMPVPFGGVVFRSSPDLIATVGKLPDTILRVESWGPTTGHSLLQDHPSSGRQCRMISEPSG